MTSQIGEVVQKCRSIFHLPLLNGSIVKVKAIRDPVTRKAKHALQATRWGFHQQRSSYSLTYCKQLNTYISTVPDRFFLDLNLRITSFFRGEENDFVEYHDTDDAQNWQTIIHSIPNTMPYFTVIGCSGT